MHTMRTKEEQATWVRHMLEEHEELRAILATTRDFLENPRPDPGETGFHRWATAMSKQLVELYDGLFRHFREEEQCGVFQDLARRYPRSSGRVERFQHQHECLLGDLRELMNEVMEYSAGIASDNPRLRRKLEDVIDRVDSHERGETELMQRMLYNDIGEGD
jgi:hypothetical protein